MEEVYKHSGITEIIIKEAYYVYNQLGYGFLEKVYENALAKKLKERGLLVEQQKQIKVFFEGEVIGEYFADIFVNTTVIVELKVVESINSIHELQLLNYLRGSNVEVGLLINFGKKIEIKRKINSKQS